MKTILQVKHVGKAYHMEDQVVHAVENVSFEVQEGEFIAIIGASGSGKSTLLHLLGGVDVVDEGEIWIEGVNMVTLKGDTKAKFRRKHIGLIYQFYNLIPVLNVKENLTLPLKLDHRKVEETKITAMMELLGLTQREHHLPSQLSGGQQQRVAIARALLMNPSILLADEPTGNLDSKSREEVIDYFCKINQEQHQTIILVTHDLDIAKRASRVLVMKDGKLQEEDQSDERAK